MRKQIFTVIDMDRNMNEMEKEICGKFNFPVSLNGPFEYLCLIVIQLRAAASLRSFAAMHQTVIYHFEIR